MKKLNGHILVVDDDPEIQSFLRRALVTEGHRVTTCSSGVEAQKLLLQPTTTENDFEVIISDVNMPEMSGLDFIKYVKEVRPDVPIIMITAFGSIESAVNAMKFGAYDYLTKPLKPEELQATVNRTLNFRNLERENIFLRHEVKQTWSLGDMIGKSPQMLAIFDLVRRVAGVTANVLILGESGTGKEMVARAIHKEGPRASKPFVAINCAAIPEDLLESELFGHAKGSFTGAIAQKRGLLEEADQGTIFLDEIGDMDMALQAKLLRVIQERKIRPVGQNTLKDIDVRIIAATHRDLKTEIAQGKFREDLYFRLSVIPIYIPPLRERPEDIPLFAEHFLKKYSLANNSSVNCFSKGAMAKLLTLPWEGNVRQLENTVERAVILTDGPTIEETHISFMQAGSPKQETFAAQNIGVLTFKEMEKRCLEQALIKAGGKKEKAAQFLGISRKTLYRKEKEYGLT